MSTHAEHTAYTIQTTQETDSADSLWCISTVLECPMDIKVIIASKDQKVWKLLMRVDPAFAAFTYSPEGRSSFIETFMKRRECKIEMIPHRNTLRIVGALKVDKIRYVVYICRADYMVMQLTSNDVDFMSKLLNKPAVVIGVGHDAWYRNGRLHRHVTLFDRQ